jgi:hypothetical protein
LLDALTLVYVFATIAVSRHQDSAGGGNPRYLVCGVML